MNVLRAFRVVEARRTGREKKVRGYPAWSRFSRRSSPGAAALRVRETGIRLLPEKRPGKGWWRETNRFNLANAWISLGAAGISNPSWRARRTALSRACVRVGDVRR